MADIEHRVRDLQRVRAAHPNNAAGSLAAVKPKPGPMVPSDRRRLYPQECTNG